MLAIRQNLLTKDHLMAAHFQLERCCVLVVINFFLQTQNALCHKLDWYCHSGTNLAYMFVITYHKLFCKLFLVKLNLHISTSWLG